jgi:Tfp pilus assembly protein PilV
MHPKRALMHLHSLKKIRDEQAGVTLIEVLISSLVLIIVSAGVFTSLTAANRATGQERHRAKANDLAEQELERVRSLRIGDLSNWNSTRRVLEDGTELAAGASCPAPPAQTCYTITSTTQFLTEAASTSTCASGTGSRDYLQLKVSVSWTGMGTLQPVTAVTNISPPSGSLVPNSGSLLVQVDDANSNGLSGVTLTGSGPGSFTGTTGATGCVLWRNLPAGNYSMSASGAAAGMVDQDGARPPGNSPTPPQTVSVVDQGTNTINLQFDTPGYIQGISFRTRTYSGSVVPSSADTATVSASDMNQVKTYGTPGGTRQISFNTGPPATLFPFTYPYTVYGGSCTANDPTADSTAAGAYGSATVPKGGIGTLAAPITLPSLLVTLMSGTSSTSPGTPISGGDVTAQEATGGCGVTRTLTATTNAAGQIPVQGDVGLPYGTYNVCTNNATATNKRVVGSVAVHSTTGTNLIVYLGGQPAGTCP